MRYAQNTLVSVEKSKAEIERMLARYGASQFVSGWMGSLARIAFVACNRKIQFDLPLPDKNDKNLYLTPTGRTKKLDENSCYRLWEQACRQRWRALALAIKAKLESVECEISTFEEEFYAHIVLPNGKTLYESTRENLDLSYKTGKFKNLLEFNP